MTRYVLAFLSIAACGEIPTTTHDAGPPDACVSETVEAFCERLGRSCEELSGEDNCGMARTVDCGACDLELGCVRGVCQAPECGSFSFVASPVPVVAREGIQDDLLAATPSGDTLIQQVTNSEGECGVPFRVFVNDREDGAYVAREIVGLPVEMDLFWGSTTMTPDGLTLVTARKDRTGFMSVSRSAVGVAEFAASAVDVFAAINADAAGAGYQVGNPALSADGLELYFTVPEQGIFVARRASTSEVFPLGERASEDVQAYEYVSGVSSDGLSLFLTRQFQTTVLSRPSTSSDEWTAASAPPTVGGWSVIPLAGCQQLVGIHSPGGCAKEDVAFFTLE
jgi:hypothetical protein